jgi:hypothetical protein
MDAEMLRTMKITKTTEFSGAAPRAGASAAVMLDSYVSVVIWPAGLQPR